MTNIPLYLLFLFGLLCIIKSGDIFVESSCYFAKITKIPEIIMGATVISFATALPELLISVISSANGSTDFAVSNMIGSVMSNIGIILGVLIFIKPFSENSDEIKEKGIIMLFSCFFIFACIWNGRFTVYEGGMLLIIGGCSVLLTVFEVRKNTNSYKNSTKKIDMREFGKNILLFIVGGVGIYCGANLLVDNGIEIAYLLNIPENIIAMTVVAVGTSLPELVTSVTALKKGKTEMSLGNIFGANIIDITVILPLCAIVSQKPVSIAEHSIMTDVPFLIALMAIATIPYLYKKQFFRFQGFMLLFAYLLFYVIIL